MNRDQLIAANRDWWNERGPLHATSPFYGIDRLVAGATSLNDFELAEFDIGAARSFVHLQCHIGTDTISWARRGLEATGLDFSVTSLEQAEHIGNRCGIEIRWVASDLYEAPEMLAETYDIVYTGKGALNWLDDIERWAWVVAKLLNSGGRLYLVEFHPISWILGEEEWSIKNDYFTNGDAYIEHDPEGSYAVPEATTSANTTAEWQHTLADIVSAIAGAGLTIRWLHEFPFTEFQQSPVLRKSEDGKLYELPPGMPRLPLMFSVCASKP